MYAKSQLEALFAKIQALKDSAITGSGPDAVATVDPQDLAAIFAEAKKLEALNQDLILGTHEHKHGESRYLFLVPAGTVFSEDDLEARLQEEFEPEHGEFLTVEKVDKPEVIEAPVPFANQA